MSKNKLYAFLDKDNKIQALIDSKEQAREVRDTGGVVVKLKDDISSRIKEIPVDKEMVSLYDVYMSQQEEEEVIEALNETIISILDAIDSYMDLIQYLKLPDNVRYQMEELNFYLSNVAESIGDGYDDDYLHTLYMHGLLTELLAQVRNRQ